MLEAPGRVRRRGSGLRQVVVALRFDWDPKKALANERKHGVSFAEATTAFADPLSITVPDPDHSDDEERFVLVGQSHRGRTLVVVHAERRDRLRIISARVATRKEKRQYEDA
jgi:uncharacterized protein